jgi:DNA-binding NarL/FixJ family response regulator
MPRLLRELIESAVGDAPDMSVVGRLAHDEPAAPSLERTNADVFILTVPDDQSTVELAPLLYRHSCLKLLAIGVDGRSASLYELRPHRVPLGELSPHGLVQAIRSAVPVGRERP